MIDGDQFHLIREREALEQLTAGELIPALADSRIMRFPYATFTQSPADLTIEK